MKGAAALYHQLGDEVRLRILRLLTAERLNVSELTAVLGLAQSGVSRHLGLLKENGLVQEQREGGFTYYRASDVSHNGLEAVHAALAAQFAASARDPVVRADAARLKEVLRVRKESFATHGGADRQFVPGRSWAAWSRALGLLLPAVDVADIGCGAGGAVLLMAEAFPQSTFVGYDISQHALERAEHRRREDNATNVRFVDPRVEPLPDDQSVDFVTTFDCIHDMTHPQQMIDAIGAALAPQGTWLLVDIKGRDTFAENVQKNPMAPLMYGISVLSCMSSALSAPDGAGLGTLGLPESRAREMALAAGFARFRTLDVDHSVNAFYEVRR
jgi:DNA-binding transcriptional ArsR family regulator